jgi:hypothetical protein
VSGKAVVEAEDAFEKAKVNRAAKMFGVERIEGLLAHAGRVWYVLLLNLTQYYLATHVHLLFDVSSARVDGNKPRNGEMPVFAAGRPIGLLIPLRYCGEVGEQEEQLQQAGDSIQQDTTVEV